MKSDAGQASLQKDMVKKPYELGLSQAEIQNIIKKVKKSQKKYKLDMISLETTGFISPHDFRKHFDNDISKMIRSSGNIQVIQGSEGQMSNLTSRLKKSTGVGLSNIELTQLKTSDSASSDSGLVFVSVGTDQSILTELAQKLPKGAKLMVLFWAGVSPPETLSDMELVLENPTFYEGIPFSSPGMPGIKSLALNVYEKK